MAEPSSTARLSTSKTLRQRLELNFLNPGFFRSITDQDHTCDSFAARWRPYWGAGGSPNRSPPVF